MKKSGSIFDDEQSWYNADINTKVGPKREVTDGDENSLENDPSCVEIVSLFHLQKFSTLKYKSKWYSIHILVDSITVDVVPIDLSTLIGDAGTYSPVT